MNQVFRHQSERGFLRDYIERHITLDRSMWGTDQSASLSSEGMRYLSDTIKKMPKILGNGRKKLQWMKRNLYLNLNTGRFMKILVKSKTTL